MEVVLRTRNLDNQLEDCAFAARQCYDSYKHSDDMGDKDFALLKKLTKLGHHSVLEHAILKFHLKGYSRGLLQQLSRHRIASQSTMSTRYTINRMIEDYTHDDYYKYFVPVSDEVDSINMMNVDRTISQLNEYKINGEKVPNDSVKFTFPESLKTNTVYTINLRSFMNLYKQRADSHAMWEPRVLVNKMYELLSPRVQELVDIYVENT